MFLQIDSHNGVPVYEQIARQVKFAVAGGLLAPGDMLPSVRELARQLAINPNTVARSYRDLQSDGVVDAASGIGLVVRTGAPRECRAERSRILQQRVGQALEEAFRAGLDGDEVRGLAEGELARLAKQFAKREQQP